MARLKNHIVTGRSGSLFGILVLASSVAVGFAQEGDLPSQPDGTAKAASANAEGLPKKEQAKFKGSASCVACHRQAEPSPGDIIPFQYPRDFCQLNEVPIFHKSDKHAIAYKVLGEGLGKEIIKRWGRDKGIKDVSEATDCLACHFGPQQEAAKQLVGNAYGLTCEVCHGASSLWEGPHREPDEMGRYTWRQWTPDVKWNKYGMKDVRNPVTRAKICFSCHIGNAKEGKVVTHAMYAAGHPPLPPIEVEEFMAAMPRHWRPFNEKGDFEFRTEYIQANPGIDSDFPRTKSLLAGRAIALGESLRLIAAQADVKQPWPELAIYDCQGCHHELRTPAWRQTRRNSGKPGRPRPIEWPITLARIGAPAVLPNEQNWRQQLDAKLLPMRHVFDEQPFGDSKKLRAIIVDEQGLPDWLDKRAKTLASAALDEAAAHRELQALYRLDSVDPLDFQTARQAAWAIRVIEIELKIRVNPPRFDDRPADEDVDKRIDREKKDRAAFKEWQDKGLKQALSDVDKFMKPLNDYLSLDLPEGQTRTGDTYLTYLLLRTAKFDPAEFRTLLDEAAKKSGLNRRVPPNASSAPQSP